MIFFMQSYASFKCFIMLIIYESLPYRYTHVNHWHKQYKHICLLYYRLPIKASVGEEIITKFNNNSGIIVEKISPLYTSSTTWSLVLKINLTSYLLRNDMLEKTWYTAISFCKNVNCSQLQQLTQIHAQLADTSNDAYRIIDLLKYDNIPPPKTKRSLLPFIGYLNRKIYGSVDELTELEMRNLIETSANDTRKLSSLFANQTEIIYKEFGSIRESTKKLEKVIIKLQKTYDNLTLESLFLNVTSLLYDNLIQYRLDTITLTNTIILSKLGFIHPSIFDPSSIPGSINNISFGRTRKFFPTEEIPGNLADVMKISDVQIFLKNSTLIYYVKIPLLDPDSFLLHKLQPIPVAQNSLKISTIFAYILPEYPYVSVNYINKTYLTFSSESLKECKLLNGIYICLNVGIIKKINENIPCELQFLIDKQNIDFSSCNIKLIRLNTSYWTRLSGYNEWAFSANKLQNITINCNNITQTLQLNNTGVLKIPHACYAFNDEVYLTASSDLTTTFGTQNFGTTYLDISEILTNTISLSLPLTHKLINNTINSNFSISHYNYERSLSLGKNLQDIIEQARSLAEYKDIYKPKDEIPDTLFNLGGIISVSTVVAIIFAIWFKTGGSPCQLISRLFSGISLRRHGNNQPNIENNGTLDSPPCRMEQLVINIQTAEQQRGIHISPHSNAPASQSNKIPDGKPNPEIPEEKPNHEHTRVIPRK